MSREFTFTGCLSTSFLSLFSSQRGKEEQRKEERGTAGASTMLKNSQLHGKTSRHPLNVIRPCSQRERGKGREKRKRGGGGTKCLLLYRSLCSNIIQS
jgi:hypothetical protein